MVLLNAVAAPIITVDLNKDSSRKPREGLIEKLTSTEKAVDLKKCEIATSNRVSFLQKKKALAANQSRKVQEAVQKAITEADEIRKDMLEKQTAAAAKAQSIRNAMTQAKINKAAIVTKKLREAQSKACTEKAKAAKAKAEKQAASAAIINIPTGFSPDRKMRKDLVDRLTPERLNRRHSRIDAGLAKAAALRDEFNKIKVTKAVSQTTLKSSRVHAVTFNTDAKLAKAEINRIAVNQQKAEKAALVSAKAQAALENANTSVAKAAKSKAQLRSGEIQIINVPLAKNQKKKANPALISRLTQAARPNEFYSQRENRAEEQRQLAVEAKMQKAAKVLDEVDGVRARNRMRKEDMQIALQEKLAKAECNNISALEEVVFKGAVESRKVMKAAMKAQTDEAKAAKAKAEARAGTEKIINIPVNKSPKKKGNPNLLNRLSLSPAYTSEYFENDQHTAFKNRVKATHLKIEKAVKVTRRTEANLARQLKNKKDKEEALTHKFNRAENIKKAMTDIKKIKAAKESTKVGLAKVKANTNEAKAAKAKAESRPGECQIINVAVAKNQKIKPNKALVSRLLKK